MALTIRYGSYCVPQEQVSADKPFWLDGDSTGKLSGSSVYTVSTVFVAPDVKTATYTFPILQDFVFAKALEIESGSYVLISLDNGSRYPIRLLKGECFAANVNLSTSGSLDAALVKVAICTATDGTGSGVGKVEVWSGT